MRILILNLRYIDFVFPFQKPFPKKNHPQINQTHVISSPIPYTLLLCACSPLSLSKSPTNTNNTKIFCNNTTKSIFQVRVQVSGSARRVRRVRRICTMRSSHVRSSGSSSSPVRVTTWVSLKQSTPVKESILIHFFPFLLRVAELFAHPGGQHNHCERGHLHCGLSAASAGVHHGLLLALLKQGDHRSRWQGELLQGHRRG